MNTRLQKRPVSTLNVMKLRRMGLDDMTARLLASRGAVEREDVFLEYKNLLPADLMKGLHGAAEFLCEAVLSGRRILTVADYDCDGATACSVVDVAMQCMGANHGYLVPDRKIHGYGLTSTIVDEAMGLELRPEIILTVDNGISSHDGVARAREYGLDVVVTDHHHAPAVLPNATFIINPNQAGCDFPSKSIAGCGVAWYLMREVMTMVQLSGRAMGCDPSELLSYVAIGTVADVVALDRNNRILVNEGLRMIRDGICAPGVLSLAQVSGKDYKKMSCQDIGFGLGPRINAAGRLSHMGAGIECLTTMDEARAKYLAKVLDETNTERKEIQAGMVDEAMGAVSSGLVCDLPAKGIVVFGDQWHEGVVGVVAGRIKEDTNKPTFVMCRSADGNIKGSGRSIPGFHLKHVLDSINSQNPGVLLKFGGHAMAAGLTIADGKLGEFKAAFERECEIHVSDEMLQRVVKHDGELPISAMNVQFIQGLDLMVWGQEFEAPVFVSDVQPQDVKVMGRDKSHLRMKAVVHSAGRCGTINAVAFGMGHESDRIAAKDCVTIAFKPSVNEFRGERSVQALIDFVDLA